MSSKPYFKLFFSDLVGDTLNLSDAQFGSYMLILGALWNHGGFLDFDDLHRVARCSPQNWPRRWMKLARFFAIHQDGTVSNSRITAELADMARLSSMRAVHGVKGGRAKALKNNKPTLAKATHTTATEDIAHKGQISSAGDAARPLEKRAALPAKTRGSLVEALGENFVASYLDRCAWSDIPKSITPAGKTAFDAIRRSAQARAALAEMGIDLGEPRKRA